MRNSKKRVRSCLSVILMFGMLLSYVPPVMAIDEVDEAVIAQEEPLETEDSSALEEEREDTEPPEPTKERDEETYSEETPVDSTSAREGSAEKMPVQKMPVQEMPVQEAPAEEAPAEEPASEEAFAEEGEQPEEILYTLTYSGLSDSAELEVRKLDPEDKDDADAISKLQKQLEEQELYDAFEISLTDGEILDEEAGARVTLHGYEVEDPEQTALYHFTDDGEIEELVYSAVDDEVSFVTKSFSPFVFAQAKEQEEQPDEAPAEEQPDEAPAEEQPDEVPAEEQEQQALDLKMKNLLSTGADNGSDSDISIDTFRATLRSGATKNDSGDYVWRATNSYADHAFIFRVTYSLSGTYEYQPGEIEIRIPKSILLNRKGELSDYYELSIPHEGDEGLTDANVYVYQEDGDNIVIYNRIKAPAAQNGYFEVSYSTAERTYEYADYDPGHTGTETGSAPFSAEITITQNEVTQKAETAKIPVYIDTTAKITSTTKYVPTYYTDWNNSWGTRPDDAGDYYYLVWEVRSIISGTTQPYNFSLVDTFNVENGEVVGYRMQGQTGYTSNGTVENLKTDYEYGRYDYVLTRHLKETYDDLVAQNGRYTVTNTVTATVDPADQVDADTQAVSSRSWTYEAPTFERPTGHFYMYKWGLDYRDDHVYDSEDIRRFDLSDYLDEKTNTIPDLAYYTYVHGYPYPWTVPAGESMDDPASYGQKPVTYELIDNELYLKAISGSYTDQLTANDYQIDKITLDWYMQDAEYDDLNKRFFATSVTYTENDIITVYAQFNGGGDWVEIGTYNLNENKGTVTADDDYGVTFSGKDLVFANTSSICTGYKLVTSNAHYYTLLGAYPHVTLKSSVTVNQVVQAAQDSGQLKIALLNRDHGNVYKGDGTEEANRIIGFVRNGTDYVIGVIRHGDIKKSEIGYRNDTVNRQYRITWSVEASESYLAEGHRRVYVNQESGTFYDLLPLGGLYVPDSVIAYADGVRLSDGQYSVKTVENYKNSGRTLLTVQYNVPADKYYFTYSTNHPWDVILEYGVNVLNSVAYETGNSDIGDGSPDDGGTITEKTLMANLDPATDAEKFIYTETSHTIKAVTQGSLGLYKQVRAAQDTAYSYSTKTYSDSDYSYLIRFATDKETVAKDLILFDSLENYTVAAGANAGATSDWHGVLTGFDLSVPEKLGIRPVVYYSTAKNLSIDGLGVNENYVFADHSEWVSADAYEAQHGGDLSAVKAFAIDLRYDKKGELNRLHTDTPVSVTVFMHSPTSITSQAQDPTAYNNIYLYNSVTDAENYNSADAVWSSKLNRQDYTQIRYRLVGDLKLLKVDSTDETTPVEGILFRLWGTSYYGTEVDETLTTNRYGRITFKNIERGTYALQEVDGVADYQQNHIQMTVTVDENGDVHIGVPEEGQDGTIAYKTDVYGNLILDYNDDTKTYIIGNEPRIHGDLEFVKKVTKDDNLSWLPGVTFQLSGTSDYGNDILMLLTSDESGTVSIQNLELGSYEMTEIAVPDGIILSQTVYTVRCDSSGILSISYTDSEGQEVAISQDKSGDYVIVNEPTHSFTLWKMDPLDNSSLSGAIFTLTGTSDYETPVDMEVTSDDNGMVKFDGLEPGSYVLKETVAPANHLLDETPRMVTVDSKGTVTIDGLTQDETYHWFPVENERSNEGVITITKAWSDSEAENHPIPVIHLDTEAPTHSLPVATISRNLWQNNACAGAYASYRGLEYATSFTHNTDATKEEVTASGSGWKKIDDGKTEYSIYFKYDSVAKQAYWWSDASIVYFPADSSGMFFNCTNLTSLDLRDFDTSKVTNMGYMFQDCNKLTNLDLSSFNTSQVNNMEYMFYKCNSLTSLNLSSFNTSKVSSMRSMFRLCSSLTSLNVSSFNTSQVYNMEYMFAYCKNLTSLNLSSFNTSRVIDMRYMFDNCQKLESLDLSNFDTSRCEYMVRMFECCYALTSLDVSSFDTSRVATMEYMFYDCEKLTSLDLSNWNTSQVINMGFIFCSCNSLKTIYASELWDMTKLTSYSSDNMMFYGCYVLVGGNGTTYDGNYTRGTYARIDKPGEPGYFTEKPAPSTPTPASHSAPTFSTPTPAKTAGENVAINQTSESKMYEGDKPEEAYNQWVKNGDGTWTYRFNVYDGDATYYIWEEALPGYTSDTDAKNPVEVTYTEGGTLTSGDPRLVDKVVTGGDTEYHNYSVKITNTKDDGTTAALTVKKTVTGGTAADREKLFTFTVTLSDKSVTGYYGDMPFVKGVATVQLKHGQSATATGLPAGVTYTVAEAEANQDGFTTTGTGETGTLVAGQTATAAFTNSKPDEPPPPEPETGGLQVTKTVERADGKELTEAEQEKKFTFTIELDNDEINGLYGDLIFKDGVATAYLAHGETVTVSGLPVGVKYTVTEKTYAGYTTTYMGETGTIAAGVIQTAEVTNTKAEVPTNGFKLKKLVSGRTSAEPFTFLIDFAGLDPNSSYSYAGPGEERLTFTSNNSGAARVSVRLNDDETAVFDGLPVGSTYTVTESASGYVASYTVTNDSGSGSIASASGANQSSGVTLQTAMETVDQDEQITVTFVNTSRVYDVSFVKYDSDGMFLDGALLQVVDETGEIVYAEWRSTGDIDTVQLPEGKYILHEAEPPEGYTVAADIPFTVGENGAVAMNGGTAAQVAMTDEETKVIVSKVDGHGNAVAGAKLQILDEEGSVVYNWVSGSEPRTIFGKLSVLTPYTLHEASAPNGYALAQDIDFILDSDGTVYIGDSVKTGTKAENLTIVMNDYKSISLPLSGSRSELACMLFGCAMITAGGLYAARRRRREAKVRSNIGKRGGRICK